MARTTNDRIAAIELEMEQLANQRKELLQKQKEADRKARTNRLCKRGGLFESMLPDTITLTDDNFKLFLEKTAANEFGRRTLANIKTEQDKQTAAADKLTVTSTYNGTITATNNAVTSTHNGENATSSGAVTATSNGVITADKPAGTAVRNIATATTKSLETAANVVKTPTAKPTNYSNNEALSHNRNAENKQTHAV
jgi:hypothetical protein